MERKIFPLYILISFAGCTPTIQPLVVHSAKIWTGNPAQPQATVLAVDKDGRFCYVGNQIKEARRLAGPRHTLLDVGDARILPGFIDAHLHLISGGLQLSRLQLRDVPDRDAFINAIKAKAAESPKHSWITGGRWSTESWPDPAQPTKEWIDPVTQEHFVFLSRMDGHGALANSRALNRADITRDGPPDPVGGEIERDPATREPTGILKDAAMDLVAKLIPPPTERQRFQALRDAQHEAHRHGITCVHTMSPWSDVQVLKTAADRNDLTLRVRVFVMEDDWRHYIDKARRFPSNDYLAVRGFKQFADGSLGSRTAFMAEPYNDTGGKPTGHRGLLREVMHPDPAYGRPDRDDENRADDVSRSLLDTLCNAALADDFVPAIHAIGDQANHLVLDTYSAAMSEDKHGAARRFPLRPRIEHAQHLLPGDIPRFATLGVVASMQPLHKADDGRYAEVVLGAERCRTSYAFRSLLDTGAIVAFGSDWPVVSLNPMLGIHAAVTGQTLDGKTFVPEQNITVEEAIRAYTVGAACASGDDCLLGVIKEGFAGDFIILDRDILADSPYEITKTGVQKTFVGGREVWNHDLPDP